MSRVPDNPSFEPHLATLLELSQKVGRLASTLANLATGDEGADELSAERPANDSFKFDPPIETVRDLIYARRLRGQFFDDKLFADPVWDMLLVLFQAELSQQPVTVTVLSMGAGVPPTNALRWVKVMTEADLIRSYPDLADPSRIFIELTASASSAMHDYFRALGKPQQDLSKVGDDPE